MGEYKENQSICECCGCFGGKMICEDCVKALTPSNKNIIKERDRLACILFGASVSLMAVVSGIIFLLN